MRESGVLPPSRIGVAAWLAALAPDLVMSVIRTNALLFASASATIELPDARARAAVVDGLLDTAGRGEQATEWGLDLAGLAYPGLSEVLELRLGQLRSDAELWWVARLAAAGGCVSAAGLLAAAACDLRWFAYARRTAALAASRLGDDEIRLSLRDLLESAEDDPDNELLATAVDILYPDLLTTRRLTEVLRPHRSSLIGNYLVRTLRSLPALIPEQDLAEFLAWFADQGDDHDKYGDLFAGLVDRAWQHVEHSPVREALARLIAAGFHSHQWSAQSSRRPPTKWVDGPDELRRKLACEVAALDEHAWFPVISLGLLNHTDLDWLRAVLPTVAPDTGSVLKACLKQLRLASHQAPVITLDESEIVPAHIEEVASALDRLESDVSFWPNVVSMLYHDPGQSFGADLTEAPGWRRLSEAQQGQLVRAGIRYLRDHEPAPQAWCARVKLRFDQVVQDWYGVHLIATLVQLDVGELVGLGEDLWKRWAHCVVATPLSSETSDSLLREYLLRIGLRCARQYILQAALAHLDELQANNRNLRPHAIYEWLAADLAEEIADRVVSGRYSGELAGNLLDVLAEVSPPTAADTCRLLVGNASPLAERAWEHLKLLDPNYVVRSLINSSASTQEIIAAVEDLDVGRLDMRHLVDAAKLLLDSFPFEDDVPLDTSDALMSRIECIEAQHTRNQVLQRLVDNGQVDDLTALCGGRSELTQSTIARHLRQAESRRADLDVPLIEPVTLLKVLARGDARLIRNDADLVAVLLRHYDDLQRYLRYDDGWREVWLEESPRVEDDISDWIRRRGLERLNTDRIVVDRELQVARPRGGGIGTRVDLTTTSCTVGGGLARVSIEAKRADSDELYTAMREQLIDRYLVPLNRRHGIYIVYWVAPKYRPQKWSKNRANDADALLNELQQQAEQAAADGFRITPYVLDVSPSA
ncbi:hypothetical protein ACFV4N_11195 [Actinosynnema sp. NPDC059797]